MTSTNIWLFGAKKTAAVVDMHVISGSTKTQRKGIYAYVFCFPCQQTFVLRLFDTEGPGARGYWEFPSRERMHFDDSKEIYHIKDYHIKD